MSAIAVNHFVVTGLVRSGVTATDAAKVLDAFHTAGGPVAVLFMLGLLGDAGRYPSTVPAAGLPVR